MLKLSVSFHLLNSKKKMCQDFTLGFIRPWATDYGNLVAVVKTISQNRGNFRMSDSLCPCRILSVSFLNILACLQFECVFLLTECVILNKNIKWTNSGVLPKSGPLTIPLVFISLFVVTQMWRYDRPCPKTLCADVIIYLSTDPTAYYKTNNDVMYTCYGLSSPRCPSIYDGV